MKTIVLFYIRYGHYCAACALYGNKRHEYTQRISRGQQ